MGLYRYSNQSFRVSRFTLVLFVTYLGLFIFFLSQPPIYSPDTYSYLGLHIYRYPGYSIFLYILQFIFQGFFERVVVGIQLLFGFIAIFLFANNCRSILKMNKFSYLALLAVLTYPYFPTLWIGNNLCSEGLAYPFYLILLTFSFDFLFRQQTRKWIHISIVLILLALTRGQFIFISPLLAFLYILKKRKRVFKKPNFFYLLLFLTLPFVVHILDSSYHKIAHGLFITTPFSYVNAVTLPLFVSKKEDAKSLKEPDDRQIFINTHTTLDSLGLLASRTGGDKNEQYEIFFQKFPIICNRTFHFQSMDYFAQKYSRQNKNALLSEVAAKEMMPILIKNNYQNYFSLFFLGTVRSLFGIIPLILVFLLMAYSFFSTIKIWTIHSGLLLFTSILILSNALLVAFAAIPIMRYLFYNFFFVILIAFVLFKKITSKP